MVSYHRVISKICNDIGSYVYVRTKAHDQVLFKRKPVQFLPPADMEDENAEVRYLGAEFALKIAQSSFSDCHFAFY